MTGVTINAKAEILPVMNSRGLPRTWTRGVWRWWYREQRIAVREANKAVTDALLYGSGFVRVTVDGVKHVPRYHTRRFISGLRSNC